MRHRGEFEVAKGLHGDQIGGPIGAIVHRGRLSRRPSSALCAEVTVRVPKTRRDPAPGIDIAVLGAIRAATVSPGRACRAAHQTCVVQAPQAFRRPLVDPPETRHGLDRVGVALGVGERAVVGNEDGVGGGVFGATIEPRGQIAGVIPVDVDPLDHAAAVGVNAVVARLDPDIELEKIENPVGVLYEIEFEFEVEDVVPLGQIPLAAVVAADGPQLHFEIAVGFKAPIDGFEGAAGRRSDERGQKCQGGKPTPRQSKELAGVAETRQGG